MATAPIRERPRYYEPLKSNPFELPLIRGKKLTRLISFYLGKANDPKRKKLGSKSLKIFKSGHKLPKDHGEQSS